ncbi:MAG: SMI1/KNR4 family protein [Leptospiraceae bacterium]|nr:SMI1/KNR4 family protein [Leptospiraceae bacterium]
MSWKGIIEEMKHTGRFIDRPSYSDADLDKWEKDHGCRFPESFRGILTQGSYEIANFYFHPLKESAEFPDFAIFAQWNDDSFAFKRGPEQDKAVFVLLSGEKPLQKFENFEQFFRNVAALTAQSNNPE